VLRTSGKYTACCDPAPRDCPRLVNTGCPTSAHSGCLGFVYRRRRRGSLRDDGRHRPHGPACAALPCPKTAPGPRIRRPLLGRHRCLRAFVPRTSAGSAPSPPAPSPPAPPSPPPPAATTPRSSWMLCHFWPGARPTAARSSPRARRTRPRSPLG
jgi:hypothetical protein